MGYSTVALIQNLIAQALSSSTPDTTDQLGNLMNVGTQLDSNNVTPAVINAYMADADAMINSTLSQMYTVPFKKKADMEMVLLASITSLTTPHTFQVSEASVLTAGDTLYITDGVQKETVEVSSTSGSTVTTVGVISGLYDMATTRLVRFKYPDPIPYISTRLASANIYDKFFAAQASPNESNYGKFFRNIARAEMNKILAGITPLSGQNRIGHLTVNPNLVKVYSTPKGWNDSPYKLDDLGK